MELDTTLVYQMHLPRRSLNVDFWANNSQSSALQAVLQGEERQAYGFISASMQMLTKCEVTVLGAEDFGIKKQGPMSP